MSQPSSYYIRKLERSAKRAEKKIEKYRAKIEKTKQKHADGKITRAKLAKKTQGYEQQIRALRARLQTARGKIGKERRRIEEGA